MDTCQLLNSTAAALEDRVKAQKGSIDSFISIDKVDEALKVSPGKWRVLIHWAGDNGISEGRMRKLKVGVIVQQDKGLSRDSGAGVTEETASGRDPIVKLRDDVDSWMRSLRYKRYRIDTEGTEVTESHPRIDCNGWRYLSSAWLLGADYPHRQIRTYYEIDCSLPSPEPEAIPVVISAVS